MIDFDLITKIAVSLGLGLLVGLQREYDDHDMAGIRTFSIVTLFGTLSAILARDYESGWIIFGGFIALAVLFSAANFIKVEHATSLRVGQTTEVAILLMYGLGAYLVKGDMKIAVVIGGIIAVLLHLKDTLGDFVDNMSGKAIKAIMQFVAISLIVLPVLPDKDYGPYGVLNPYNIWMMVVLIVGLGLAGFFIYKWFGKNTGTFASGILGGLISSTATTITFSKRSKDTPHISMLAAFIIVIASTVALVRVLVEVSVVSPQNLGVIAPPIIAELIIMAGLSGYIFWVNKQKEEKVELPEPDNPAQLKTAFIFAFLYGVILVGVAFAKDYFGQSGLYAIAVISGLTDVDAITLSLSNTLNRGEIDVNTAWKLILLASLANLLFKGSMAAVLGTKKLTMYLFILFGISIVTGLLIIWLWPEGWSI